MSEAGGGYSLLTTFKSGNKFLSRYNPPLIYIIIYSCIYNKLRLDLNLRVAQHPSHNECTVSGACTEIMGVECYDFIYIL